MLLPNVESKIAGSPIKCRIRRRYCLKTTGNPVCFIVTAAQACGPLTLLWPSSSRKTSVSPSAAWWMASRAPWITWWTSCTSSWSSPHLSLSTLASSSSSPCYSSRPDIQCTFSTLEKPRENTIQTHKKYSSCRMYIFFSMCYICECGAHKMNAYKGLLWSQMIFAVPRQHHSASNCFNLTLTVCHPSTTCAMHASHKLHCFHNILKRCYGSPQLSSRGTEQDTSPIWG